MLDKIHVKKKMDKGEYKAILEDLSPKVSLFQRKCKELGIPVMIVFEGWGASGKGTLINRLIRPLDPRGFQVFSVQEPNEEEFMRPFLWRFWVKTPAKGRIHIFDRSWYQRTLRERGDELDMAYGEIKDFEEQLTEDGCVLIKFFLHISKKEQKKRFQKLESSKETAWRVNKNDWKQNKHYDLAVPVFDAMLTATDTEYAPWTVVEATDREYAEAKILAEVCERMSEAVAKKMIEKAREEAVRTEEQKESGSEGYVKRFQNGALDKADLSKSYTKEEYKERLKVLQERLSLLHNEMYAKRQPVVLAFEGWDAGGKGGAIKRITECIDPRGYEVVPTASPNDTEKAHHYLWRFWNKMPKAGHMAIFDRTWYGRVMVERIEGFCTKEEWKRAYTEINHMEEQLSNAGCVVCKFWMQIDKDEQKRRFTDRQNTPEKQWKITDEDWRNREKWDAYEEAVDEMIVKTSTVNAPWTIVEANSKYYARIKVLETVVEALEKRFAKQ